MTRSSNTRRKLAHLTTALLLCGLALATSVAAVKDTDGAPGNSGNNAGTVKIHETNETGDTSNDPHVGCPFYVEGFNMEGTSGSLVIKSWPPTGNKTVVLDDTWTADGAEPQNHFVNGPYSLPDGHYKLFVSDVKHDKQKVFWTEDCDVTPPCPEGQELVGEECVPIVTPCPPNTHLVGETCVPDTQCPPDTHLVGEECVDDGTTEIPVFPSATALTLGTIGALGSALVAFRRKL